MQEVELPVEAGGAGPRADHWLDRLTGWVAGAGGVLMLAVGLLVTLSVTLRWLFNAPIDGDFEFVKMATAIAIFAYLPYTQARRANIMVDSLTGWMPAGGKRAIDAFWDLAYAGLMAYVGFALIYGSLDAIKSGETTMQRQLLMWPSIALATALCLFLVMVSVVSAVRVLRSRGTP